MKAILISIKPKWVAKILNGEKTIEVRTSKALSTAIQKLIDENGYADIYVYCTKPSLKVSGKYAYKKELVVNGSVVNGKVIFKFRCYKVEEIENHILHDYMKTKSLSCVELKKQSCLDLEDLYKYLDIDNGYAIHISDLEIFEKPKELNEFRKLNCDSRCPYIGGGCDYCSHLRLTRPPQNFAYIEVEE